MQHSHAGRIALSLAPEDATQLRLLDRGLRTNEALPHSKEPIDRLIEQGLVRSEGIAVRVTPLGYEVLKYL